MEFLDQIIFLCYIMESVSRLPGSSQFSNQPTVMCCSDSSTEENIVVMHDISKLGLLGLIKNKFKLFKTQMVAKDPELKYALIINRKQHPNRVFNLQNVAQLSEQDLARQCL